jgi:hypothetical protein
VSASARGLSAATGLLGATLLVRPLVLLGVVAPPDRRVVTWAGRLLGGRLTLQALVMAARPRRPVFAGAAVIDGLHASSMLAVAGVDRRYRRAALGSAAAATVSAVVTTLVRRRLPA